MLYYDIQVIYRHYKLFYIIFMPSVQIKENEPFEIALRRFKRICEKAGILTEIRRREFYEKPTAMRKRKLDAATKRHKRKVSMNIIRKKPPYKKF